MIINRLNREPTIKEIQVIYSEIADEFKHLDNEAINGLTPDIIKDENYIKVLYGVDNEIYGCTVFCVEDNTLIEIILYIRKPYRKHLRLPMFMIKDMEHIAILHNCKHIKTGSSLGRAELIQKLYKAAGYKTVVVRMEKCVEI